jgi:CRISPR-associated endonuclease/helicase Cas3
MASDTAESFRDFFERATGQEPYPYQEKLAALPLESRLIHVPTGCGKTAAVVLAWVWRLRVDPANTPRRLGQPMLLRVLVEEKGEQRVVVTVYTTSKIDQYTKGVAP